MSEVLKRLISNSMPIDALARKADLVPVPRLEVLATDIRKAHDQIESTLSMAAFTAVERGIEIGKWLIEAKKLAGYGNYEDYIARNFPFSMKTAQNYTRLAKQEAKLRQKLEQKRTFGSFLPMKESLEFIDMLQGKKSKR
jgi:Protein of unknown function (DUF3102)